MSSFVFSDIMPHVVQWKSTKVSEEPVSIFRRNQLETRLFLRNADLLSPDYTAL
jgi:hypothetical protein